MVVIIFYIALCLKIYTLTEIRNNPHDVVLIFISLSAGIFIHGLINYWLHYSFNIHRFLETFVFLILFLLGAFSFVLVAKKSDEHQVDFVLKFVFYALIIVGILSILGYSPFFSEWKAMVFYMEPSHFALSFLPFLLYIAVQSDIKYKLIWLAISFEIALMVQNLTLILGIIFISILVLPIRKFLVLLASFSLLFYTNKIVSHVYFIMNNSAVGANMPDAVSYVADRVSLTSPNLSVLVFKSGWERAYLNFIDNFGFGIGFQQLGFVGRDGEIMTNIMNVVAGQKTCLLDGATVAAKLVSEFGMMAIVALGLYSIYAIRYAVNLRELSLRKNKIRDSKYVFFLACFLMFCIDLFVRGTGYFSSSAFLFTASLIWILMLHSKSTGMKS
ncbi:hypothetical protein GALL_204570 [mine drainage metagenome]|uniref:O-antigen ligase n=1 Tax=mine drainage metagenome TaxID=410659 RepID=A0A1J5SBH3_9ZZZZ